MIEFTVESMGGPNIDEEFQLSILAAKTGQTISRTHISEQPNFCLLYTSPSPRD